MVRRWAVRGLVAVLACLPLALAMSSEHGPASAPRESAALASGTIGGDPSEPEPTQSAPERRKVTIALTGDVLIHDSVWASARRLAARAGEHRAFDFRPMLADLKPVLAKADLALCHLETPLAPAGGPYYSYPVFSAPPQVVGALRWVGYDGCTTASNHSVDQGFDGVVRTLDDLDRAGLAHTGTSRSRAEQRTPVILDVHGLRIGWLSYTYGTNGMPVDSDKPWSINLIDPQRILRDAHRARAAGADAVLVALHWGNEYQHTPSDYQLDLARQLTRSPDITMIYGHHAHVTQPIRKIHGKWVVFGLGNLLADQATVAPGVKDGMIALVTLTQRGDGPVRVSKVRSVPTHIDTSAPPYGEIRVSRTTS